MTEPDASPPPIVRNNSPRGKVRAAFRPIALITVFMLLTLLSQIGGLVWLACRWIVARACPIRWGGKRRMLTTMILSLTVYGLLTVVVIPPVAASFGRVRLPCWPDAAASLSPDAMTPPPLVAATSLTCFLNRGYVRPALRDLLSDLAKAMAQRFPGSRITTLEGGFPFIDGFPLLPHLSHRDGRKVDIAFLYRATADQRRIESGAPSPLGYFRYEQPAPGETPSCQGRWAPLRWDFAGWQPAHPAWSLDAERTAAVLAWLKTDPRVSKIFIEPYLAQRLGAAGGKVRFQGCRAARHDDHIHIEME